MIAIKRILCPTDFSDCAEHALGYGGELARRFGAELHVHHAIAVPYMAVAYEIGPDVGVAREAARREAAKKLEAKAVELRKQGLNVQTHLTAGTPFVDIVTVARDRKIDLIVMGTHGLGPIQHLLLGSTAERVVRKAPCPVLTVKSPGHEFVMP